MSFEEPHDSVSDVCVATEVTFVGMVGGVTSAAEQGFGWLVPVRKLSVLGVTEQADLDWLGPKLTPHPWKTYTDRLQLTGAVDGVPAAFVECVSWMRVFAGQADRARTRGWPVHELETGHEAMVTAPGELAGVLIDLAGRLPAAPEKEGV